MSSICVPSMTSSHLTATTLFLMESNLQVDSPIGLGRWGHLQAKMPTSGTSETLPWGIWRMSQDYAKAIEISQSLLQQGTPVGAGDMLFAAMAMNRKAALLTKGRDFRQ